ncbi:hypothetical protein [Agrobacterium rosae]|uniref:hypothetical protein n=1 Tax=Agrobacterium rosae TaxID=1972867 RepID=UPI002033A3A5|nr:hypothetical protein [Agrobacterium rosae]MCM2436325.1 hypothetical protein [Agrobacterium rosae]
MTVHVSYATSNFSQAAQIIQKSARRFGIYDSRVYCPEDPVIRSLSTTHSKIMTQRRGAGYWLWKPYVIGDVLDNVADGTVVVYTDVAMTFVADPTPLLNLVAGNPIALFHLVPNHSMSTWTKRDCFVQLDADYEEYWRLPQLTAAFQVYRAGAESRAFIKALQSASSGEVQLTDIPNRLGLPNFSDFKDHRHDQSILTILAAKHGIETYPDPSQFGPWAHGAYHKLYGQIFHMHRRQDKGWLGYAKNRYKKVFTGGRYFI